MILKGLYIEDLCLGLDAKYRKKEELRTYNQLLAVENIGRHG